MQVGPTYNSAMQPHVWRAQPLARQAPQRQALSHNGGADDRASHPAVTRGGLAHTRT